MAKKVITIDFRPKTPAPTEEGWHYARYIHGSGKIIPTKVERLGDIFFVRIGECNKIDLDALEWFGPVTEVREASKGE